MGAVPGLPEKASLADQFKHSMSLLVAGVAVVTTTVNDRPWGMTITACCSVSADPPTILISLAKATATAQVIGERGEYGLCLMGSHGVGTARFGSAPGQPKFLDSEDRVIRCPCQTPCATGTITHLDCVVSSAVDAGDHVVLLGRVRGMCFPSEASPLAYGMREYQRVVPAGQLVPQGAEDHALAYSAW